MQQLHSNGPALRLNDWVFLLERNILHAKDDAATDTWMLGAFKGNTHYSFGQTQSVAPYVDFMESTVRRFAPFIAPDIPTNPRLSVPSPGTSFPDMMKRGQRSGGVRR